MTRLSLKPFVARLRVSPPTTSLSESTALLKRLQSVAHPAAFSKATHPAAVKHDRHQEFDLVYLSLQQLLHVCKLSPITVQVNQNLPDPTIQDPYNVRGLQDRKQLLPKTFTCHIDKRDDGYTFSGRNLLSNPFAPSNMSSLYQGLQESKAPETLIDAFGASAFGDGHMEDLVLPDQKQPEDLAKMHREATSTRRNQTQSLQTRRIEPSNRSREQKQG